MDRVDRIDNPYLETRNLLIHYKQVTFSNVTEIIRVEKGS